MSERIDTGKTLAYWRDQKAKSLPIPYGIAFNELADALEQERAECEKVQEELSLLKTHWSSPKDVEELYGRVRLLERDNLRYSAALFDALAQFDHAGDLRWNDIERDHSLGRCRIAWDDQPSAAPKEGGKR